MESLFFIIAIDVKILLKSEPWKTTTERELQKSITLHDR